jgi:glycosyltransferase involved in cell wall biosynthesis
VKFALITPRYGADITAGPEQACRLLAENLCERHDVDVLTTTARDARTWKNETAEGADRIRGVLIRRFPVGQTHDRAALRQMTGQLLQQPHSRGDELEWVRRLGPWSPALNEYLKRQHRGYDALVFFSLWHPTTVHGLQVAPERSILFPHVQLKPELRFGLWGDVLGSARAIGYLSGTERRLVRRYVHAQPAFEEVVGIGVDPPTQQSYPRHQQDPADAVGSEDEAPGEHDVVDDHAHLTGRGVPFRRRHRLYGDFALYGGRVQGDNGCEEMLEYFNTYAERNGEASLVLMGVKMMKVPEEPYLRMAGVLPDRERMIAYEAAALTVAPAPDDLLSLPLLESLAVGTPVLASAMNDAAVEHCRAANGGLYYANRDEFVEAMRVLMSNPRLRERLGENGRTYVRNNYRWEAVLGRFERLVAQVKGR